MNALQTASVYATIANGGVRVTPNLIAGTTDDKDTYVIHLAPEWSLKDQGLTVKAGDRVSFKGRWVMVDGKKYFVASQVTPPDGKVWVLRREDGTRTWTWR